MLKQGSRALLAWGRDGAALARALAKEELRRAGFVPRDEMERLEATLARLEQEVAALRQEKAGQREDPAEPVLETEEEDGTGDGA